MMLRVQKELGHLVVGKAVSTLMGLAVLLLMWRQVTPAAYGQYLSLMAAAEILALVSALGVSTVSQRYLPIWIVHASSAWHALGRIAQVVCVRIGLAALCLSAGLAIGPPRWGAWSDWFAVASPALALGLVLITVSLRSLEEVQALMLMQAWIQGGGVMAHGWRLVALALLAPGELVGLDWLVRLELAIASSALFVGLVATGVRTIRGVHLDDSLRTERPSSWWYAWTRSLPFWLIQCLGLVWSVHTIRVLLQAIGGPVAVAVHGVAHALVESWRQASPLVWATGWLRAAMLRLHASQPQSNRALELASAVHRLSLLILWPVVAAWCVEPAAWFRWVAGTELFIQAQHLSLQHPWVPPCTGLLAAVALQAPLQNRHLLISLWAYVHQRPGWGVIASALAVIPVVAFGWLWPLVGLWSVPVVIVTAEILWVVTASKGWVLHRRIGEVRGRPIEIPLAALTSAGLVSLLLADTTDHYSAMRLGLPLLAAIGASGAVAWKRSLWTADEKAVLENCMPSAASAIRMFWSKALSR